jgi:hypothetical protein
MLKTIYVLRDHDSGAVRYVGATRQPLAKRLSVHVSVCRTVQHACARWIRALIDDGKRPMIEAIAKPTDEWERAERDTIARLRADGCDLLNMTDGGMGMRGHKPSQASNDKRSRSLRAAFSDPAVRSKMGHRLSREEREALSQRMREVWRDPMRAAKQREAMRGSKARRAAERRPC